MWGGRPRPRPAPRPDSSYDRLQKLKANFAGAIMLTVRHACRALPAFVLNIMIETGLAGKVVIVTGAAAGIGRATALRFALEGARVAAWDVNAAEGASLAAEIAARGGKAEFALVDVSSQASVE